VWRSFKTPCDGTLKNMIFLEEKIIANTITNKLKRVEGSVILIKRVSLKEES